MTERGPDGKFLPGNRVSAGNKGGGRPTSDAAERLRASLEDVVGNGTLPKWKAAMKRRLERGDQWATEFVFNRMVGKVPDKQEIGGMDGDPLEIIIRHVEIPHPDYTGSDANAETGSD